MVESAKNKHFLMNTTYFIFKKYIEHFGIVNMSSYIIKINKLIKLSAVT